MTPDQARDTLLLCEADASLGDPSAAAIAKWIESGLITSEQVIGVLADAFSMEMIDLTELEPSPAAIAAVDRDLAIRYNVFPIHIDDSQLEVATSDPLDMDAIDSLSHVTNKPIRSRLATPAAIQQAIEQFYDTPAVVARSSGAAQAETEALVESLTVNAAAMAQEDAPIMRYVHGLIAAAIECNASDIHLEPLANRFRVRFRVDGVLQEVENPPKRLQPSVISRLKLMADVSIAQKRIPQDGRIQLKTNGESIDLRVSVLPTIFGESIVMRILDKAGLNLGLHHMGFFSDDQVQFERFIAMPDGIFLVTGPTGSGKSTTLYAALNHLNHSDRKIITVEDPVEYQLTGINQVGVNRDVGMTFAAALRSILRQAPNIIMVGEIRDRETAEIAVNASLTGHMVYSTLHTNDAPSAVTRLTDMGVKPFLVSAALRGVLAQRLVRRICSACKQPYLPDRREIDAIGIQHSQVGSATFYRGTKCRQCADTGYKGRLGIFEIFSVSEEIQQMIYDGKSLVSLRQKARALGMRTLRDDGVRKIRAGLTTIEEVLTTTVV